MDYTDNVTFISFNYENLKKVRAILPNQSAQYLFGEITDEIREMLVRDRIDVDVCASYLTKADVEYFHAAGLVVNCWTVDNAEFGERLAEMGVDFITSNILE